MPKGTASSNKMMPYMDTYGGQNNPSYKPPSGSAGSQAKGLYSKDKSSLSVPMKGSQIRTVHGNSDRMKVMKMKDEQAANESLRGQPCC